MKKVILFWNLNSLTGLQLAKQFLLNENCVYAMNTEVTMKELRDNVCNVHDILERKSLIRVMERIRYVKPGRFGKDGDTDLGMAPSVSLWISDSYFEVLRRYVPKAEFSVIQDNREEETYDREQFLLRSLDGVNVNDVNFISSMYGEKCTGITELVAKLGRKARFYAIPLLTYDSKNGAVNIVERVAYWINNFISWVELRIPDYFLSHSLHVKVGKKVSIVIADLDDVVNNVYICYNECETDIQYRFTTLEPMYADEFFTKVGKLIENTVKKKNLVHIAHEGERQNLIEQLFQRILEFYLPALFEEPEKVQCAHDIYLKPVKIDNFQKLVDKTCEEYLEEKHRTVQKEMKSIVIDEEQQITYYTAGKGDAIVIVNAFGAFVEAWEQFMYELSKNYYVVIWDIRGVDNGTDALFSRNLFGVESQVEDIKRVVDREQLQHFHIIAWCSGVKSAVIYAVQNKDRVKSLISLAGDYAPYSGIAKNPSKFRDNLPLVEELLQGKSNLLKVYMNLIFDGMFREPSSALSNEEESHFFEILPLEYRERLLSLFQSEKQTSNFLRICVEYYKHDISEYLQKLKIPVLLIASEFDKVAPMEQSYWACSQIENADIYCLPSAVHVMMLERSNDIIRYIRQHMNQMDKKERGLDNE